MTSGTILTSGIDSSALEDMVFFTPGESGLVMSIAQADDTETASNEERDGALFDDDGSGALADMTRSQLDAHRSRGRAWSLLPRW